MFGIGNVRSGSDALGGTEKVQNTPWYAYAIPVILLGLGTAGLAVAGKYFDISPDALIAVGTTAIVATMLVAIALRVKSKLWERIEGDWKEKFFQIGVIGALAALAFGALSLHSTQINLFDRTVSSFTNNNMYDWIIFGAGSGVIALGLGTAGYIYHRRNKEEASS